MGFVLSLRFGLGRALLMAAVLMAGCSSNVKLTDDNGGPSRAAVNTVPGGAGGLPSQQVAPVSADTAAPTVQGPSGVGRSVYFDYGSSALKAEFRPLIESHAAFLKSHGTLRVIIAGHTDERGGREYNLALGQQRAERVRSALKLLGVQDTQLDAVSFGEETPAGSGHDEAAWAKERRAELNYK